MVKSLTNYFGNGKSGYHILLSSRPWIVKTPHNVHIPTRTSTTNVTMSSTDVLMSHISTLKKNTKTDPRQMRRIIAEDPEWNLATVSQLSEICLKHIVENFAEKPILHELLKKHKTYVLNNLPVHIPLSITANLIEDKGIFLFRFFQYIEL